MKKLLNIFIITAAMIMVNNSNAKQLVTISKPTITNMASGAKDLLNPNIAPADKKEIAEELIEDLKTAGLEDYSKLLVQRGELTKELEDAITERDAFKIDNSTNNSEWKDANTIVIILKSQLRRLNRKIRPIEATLPKETTITVKQIVLGLGTILGITLAAEYYLRPEGYMRTLLGHKAIKSDNQGRSIPLPQEETSQTPFSGRELEEEKVPTLKDLKTGTGELISDAKKYRQEKQNFSKLSKAAQKLQLEEQNIILQSIQAEKEAETQKRILKQAEALQLEEQNSILNSIQKEKEAEAQARLLKKAEALELENQDEIIRSIQAEEAAKKAEQERSRKVTQEFNLQKLRAAQKQQKKQSDMEAERLSPKKSNQ